MKKRISRIRAKGERAVYCHRGGIPRYLDCLLFFKEIG